jgi:hypothetical protein
MFSKLWTVKMTDAERMFVIAVFSAPIGILYDWATVVNYEFSWNGLIKGAVAGGLGYIIKNFITGSNGNILTNK